MEMKEAMRLLNRAKSLLRHAIYHSREFDEHRKYLISSIEDFEGRHDQDHIVDADKMVSLRDQFAIAALPLAMMVEGIDVTTMETAKDIKESNTKELTIYKYPFPTCNQSSVAKVQLPRGEVIRIDEDDGFPFIWLLVDKNDLGNVEHTFYLHKTGSTIKGFDSIESAHSKFVGTISLWAEMELMFYIFHGGYSDE